MQVDDALIEKLSKLSMLRFNGEERKQIAEDLEQMIGFIDQLKEVDTSGVEPLLHLSGNNNVLREDVPGNMISREEALLNSADSDKNYFLVPKVIRKPE